MGKIKVIMIFLAATTLLAGCGERTANTAIQSTQNGEYHLKTDLGAGGMTFIGVGGEIAGQTNPTLRAKAGDTVSITLTNTDGIEHDIIVPDFNAKSQPVSGQGTSRRG